MKNKEKIIQRNTEVINQFLSMYGASTQKDMSEFLFQLQGLYLGQTDVGFSEGFVRDIVTRFAMLYHLVNDIQAVKKDS